MYYDIAPYILRNRKKLFPITFLIVFINYFLYYLIQGNLDEIFNMVTLKGLLMVHCVFGPIYFGIKAVFLKVRNWELMALFRALVPLGIIFYALLLVYFFVAQWLTGDPTVFINYILLWWFFSSAIAADAKNLLTYFYIPETAGIPRIDGIFHDITIGEGIVDFTATSKEITFIIADIEIEDITVQEHSKEFFITIKETPKNTDKYYYFSIYYTKKNFEVLKELIPICKKTPMTIEGLDMQVSQSSWSLDDEQESSS